jgi:hypothetical protein
MTRTFVQPVVWRTHRRKSAGVRLPRDLVIIARKAEYFPSGDVRVTPALVSLARQPAGLVHL